MTGAAASLRRSLAQWQAHVADDNRLMMATPQEAWLRLVEQAGEVARAIRTRRTSLLSDGFMLAAPLASLVRFASVMDFDLAEAAWAKYPAVCPYCVTEIREFHQLAARSAGARAPGGLGVLAQCCCPPPPKRVRFNPDADWLAGFRQRDDIKPVFVQQWQAMFSDVYSHRHGSDLNLLAYHFIEEIGEVASEVRRGDLRSCSYEAADVLSWIFSLANTASAALGVQVALEERLPDAFELLVDVPVG